MKLWLLFIIVLIVLIDGCKNDSVSPLAFKHSSTAYGLAIEGGLNTLNTEQYVKLSEPAVSGHETVSAASGATVSISDGYNEVFFAETRTPGVYSGKISDNKNYGRSYQLKISYHGKQYFASDTLVALQADNLPFTATRLPDGRIQLNIPAHLFGTPRPLQWLIAYKGVRTWDPSLFNVPFAFTYSSERGAPNAVYPLTQEMRTASLSPGDTVTVLKFSQSHSYGMFLYNLFEETDFKSAFSSETGNVYGNVSGNAQGYFYCTDISVTKYLAKDLAR